MFPKVFLINKRVAFKYQLIALRKKTNIDDFFGIIIDSSIYNLNFENCGRIL